MWWVPWVVVLTACGRFAFDPIGNDGGADVDASCAQPSTFYRDADGDGHGDGSQPVSACTQPQDAAVIGDDCDDGDRYRYPGATEVCDGADNDCDSGTVETCAAQCVPTRRPAPDNAHAYLFCGGERTWSAAQAFCAGEGFTLARIDDAAENTWLAQQATAIHTTPQQWVGGSDLAAEGVWRWPDGTQFWQGLSNGTSIGGAYTLWDTAEPNDSDAMGEDCLGVLPSGLWNDLLCDPTQRDFTCERD